jgi:hypothetical protein
MIFFPEKQGRFPEHSMEIPIFLFFGRMLQNRMPKESKIGGTLDNIYHCPSLENVLI